MATAATNPKQEAHELIERLSTGQVIAAVGLFKAMLDPVSIALANAPYDDEPVSDEEARDIAEARAAAARGEIVSNNEEVLREFGLSPEDFERMGRTPLDPEPHHPGQ
jgi:PAS domain-containing protein